MTMDRMNRKQFLGTSLRLGACCGAALLLERAGMACSSETPPSPCEKTADFAKGVTA